MNSSPLVTVLMPCYNAMPYLTEALESMMNQTYRNLEILCINDGSSDTTGDILEEYAKKDARIRVVHNESNLKLIRTLNKGIELANGEFIARMDADDISLPDRIQIEMDYFSKNPEYDLVCPASLNMDPEGNPIAKNIPRQFGYKANLYASFYYVPIGHPEILVRTKVLKENHFLVEEHALHTEDYEIWSRLLRKGYHLVNTPEILHKYRIHDGSVSRQFTEIQDRNFTDCVRRQYKEYADIDYPIEMVSLFVNRFQKGENSVKEFKTAFREMNRFKELFIKNEEISDNNTLKEIETVYRTHKLDILIQMVKKGSLSVKLFAMFSSFKNLGFIFDSSVRSYLRSKRL